MRSVPDQTAKCCHAGREPFSVKRSRLGKAPRKSRETNRHGLHEDGSLVNTTTRSNGPHSLGPQPCHIDQTKLDLADIPATLVAGPMTRIPVVATR